MKRGSLYLGPESAGQDRSLLSIDPNPFGSGADANIHRIVNRPELAAKIYHEPGRDPDRPEKIRAMLAMPPDLPPIRGEGTSYIQVAWPTGMVEDDRGRFVGYTMPFVDLNRSTQLANLLVGKTRQVMKLPEFYGFRVVSAANLAALVATLHARSHHIIDLKPVNLSVYLDTFYLALLDCDGLSIQGEGGRRFVAHQYTDGYIAPEALQRRLHPQDLGEEQDRFALAVIIFQLLNRGIHPYQGVPRQGANLPPTDSGRIQQNLYAYGRNGHKLLEPSPWSIHVSLEDETRELFDRAFGLNPKLRPTADAWRRHLQNLADPQSGLLQKCPRNPDHGMFSKGCGLCHLEKNTGIKPQKLNSQKAKRKARITSPAPAATRPPARNTRGQRTRQRHGAAVPGAAGTVPSPQISKSAITWIFAISALIFGLIYFASQLNNIHAVIRSNDQKAFFDRRERGAIKWELLSIEDLTCAMVHEDERIFLAIMENMKSVPFEISILEYLVRNHREKSALAYIDSQAEVPTDRRTIRAVLDAESSQVQNLYGSKFKAQEGSYRTFDEIFLDGDADDVRDILSWGAWPDFDIRIPKERSDLLKKLHGRPATVSHFGDYNSKPGDSKHIWAVRERYRAPFKIPGLARVGDLQRKLLSLEKYFEREDVQQKLKSNYYHYQPRHEAKPLTIAVLKGDLETVRVLLSTGAKTYHRLPYDMGLFDVAPNPEISLALKEHGLATYQSLDPAIKLAVVNDDPESLISILNPLNIKERDAALSYVVNLGKMADSLRVLDLVIKRYELRSRTKSLHNLVKAYQFESPMLLAYYLRLGVPYDSLCSLEEYRKAGGRRIPLLDKLNLEDMDDSVRERIYAQKIHKVGKLLQDEAQAANRWDMDFVLEDDVSKWSDLHLAVLAENEHRMRTILQADPGRIEEGDAKGRTPIILAAIYQCNAAYKVLMDYTPDLTAEDQQGYTPLMHAASYGNKTMVLDMLDKGTRLNTKSHPACAMVQHVCSENRAPADKLGILLSRYWMRDGYPAHVEIIQDITSTCNSIETAAVRENWGACQ